MQSNSLATPPLLVELQPIATAVKGQQANQERAALLAANPPVTHVTGGGGRGRGRGKRELPVMSTDEMRTSVAD